MENVAHEEVKVTGRMLEIKENEIRGHLEELMKKSVEETLNKMLKTGAECLCGAKHYEGSADCQDTWGAWKLQTRVGEVDFECFLL